MQKLGLALAGSGLRGLEASGHIAYKSPGHLHTKHCLTRAAAPLSGDGPTLEDTEPHALHAYMHKCAGWKKTRAWREAPARETVSLCGS